MVHLIITQLFAYLKYNPRYLVHITINSDISIKVSDEDGPSSIAWRTLNTGWKSDDKGWWYQNDAGDYIQYDWLKEGEDWYFFNQDGYMIANTVIKWGADKYYFGTDGKMVTNKEIPDGRKAGLDGVLSGKIKDASKVLSLVAEDEANGPGADLDNANTDGDSAKGPGGDIKKTSGSRVIRADSLGPGPGNP